MREQFKNSVTSVLSELKEDDVSLKLDAYSTFYNSGVISITLSGGILCAVSEVSDGCYSLAHFVDGERRVEYPKNEVELKSVMQNIIG